MRNRGEGCHSRIGIGSGRDERVANTVYGGRGGGGLVMNDLLESAARRERAFEQTPATARFGVELLCEGEPSRRRLSRREEEWWGLSLH